MTNYVLGFVFHKSELILGEELSVVLIRKTHPENQRGLLNGIGGRVREDESWQMAMERECLEEIDLSIVEWHEFSELSGLDFIVKCYWAMGPRLEDKCPRSMTDEIVGSYYADGVASGDFRGLVPDVPGLVKMALEEIREKY